MPSSKRILKSVRHRMGWTLLIAGAALAAVIVAGDSLVAALIAVGAVVVVGALIPGRESEGVGPQRDRAPGQPYAISHAWAIDRSADLADLAQVLESAEPGLRQRHGSADGLIMWGGSQLRTRLFGGYFVDPKRLPVEVELTEIGVDGNRRIVRLGVRDRLGVAIRDETLEGRLAKAVKAIHAATATQLAALGAVEVELADGRSG